jgi:hypothetical protein
LSIDAAAAKPQTNKNPSSLMAERGLEYVEVQNGSRSSPLTNMQRDPKPVDLEKQDAAGVVPKQLQQQQTPVSLTWSNLSVTVSVLHGQHARLLHNSTGN